MRLSDETGALQSTGMRKNFPGDNRRHDKRRRDSNPSNTSATKRSYNSIDRGYGDTFAAGNAIVHNGDNLNFYQRENTLQDDARELQQSLYFPGMHQRYENLREAHHGTFEWILKPNRKAQCGHDPDAVVKRQLQMRTFLQWYETGSGIYWISGKPGSGKSTLMKYLIEHMNSYDNESPRIGPIIVHFFFWISGEAPQRSISGCLKSLIWQLLQNLRSREVAVQICKHKRNSLWTEHQLYTVLLDILLQLDEPLILFIDGLDESDDQAETLTILHDIVDIDDLKLCVSSRPELIFAERFRRVCNLKLEDLNNKDIQHYVEQKFLRDAKVAALSADTRTTREDGLHALARNITWKSEGVFLWVYLVVKDLLKGISNKDSIHTLFQRIDRLPRGIHELYQDMLLRGQDDAILYRNDASLYFALILHRNFNLLEFCFAIDDQLRSKYLDPTIFDSGTDVGTDIPCDTVKTWIHARTAGLLEVRVVPDDDNRALPEETQNAQISRIFRYSTRFRISFVHRTALDFLRDTAPGRSLLNPSVHTVTKVKNLCFQANLISRLVLPSLQGLGFPSFPASYYHSRVLDCRICTDEDIFMGIQSQDQIFRSSCQYDSLHPSMDHSQERESNLSSMPRRLLTSDSLPCHNIWDLAPYLIFKRRYRAAMLWLENSGFVADDRYLSSLLGPLMLSFQDTLVSFLETRDSDHPALDRNRLLMWLVAHGAGARVKIPDNSGEAFTALSDVIMSSRGHGQQTRELYRIIGITSEDLATLTQSTCYAFHADCLDTTVDPYIWKFLGNVCPADGCTLGLKGDTFLTPYGERIVRRQDDQILVVSATSADPDLCPILWAVSEEDSRSLIAAFRIGRYNPASEYGMHHRTRCALFNQPSDPHQLLSDVCRRSRVVSFADAMRHMGKSEETIRIVYQEEGKRMVRMPESRFEVWRKWYWKTSVLPRDQDHVPHTTGYSSSWEDLVQEIRVDWPNCYSWRHTEI